MRSIVPIKMYEYMACGKPVVSTGLPGIVEEFGQGNGVVFVDGPGEVLEMAVELVEKCCLGEYGTKARKFVEKYSWDKITNQFEDTLREVLLDH